MFTVTFMVNESHSNYLNFAVHGSWDQKPQCGAALRAAPHGGIWFHWQWMVVLSTITLLLLDWINPNDCQKVVSLFCLQLFFWQLLPIHRQKISQSKQTFYLPFFQIIWQQGQNDWQEFSKNLQKLLIVSWSALQIYAQKLAIFTKLLGTNATN